MPAHYTSIDDYMDSFDGKTRERLEEMRKLVRAELPDAEERISYNIPAYFVGGKLIIYFAGFKQHIGVYPGRTESEAYNKLAEQYASGASTARFPHSEPLPVDVIKNYIQVRLSEV